MRDDDRNMEVVRIGAELRQISGDLAAICRRIGAIADRVSWLERQEAEAQRRRGLFTFPLRRRNRK